MMKREKAMKHYIEELRIRYEKNYSPSTSFYLRQLRTAEIG